MFYHRHIIRSSHHHNHAQPSDFFHKKIILAQATENLNHAGASATAQEPQSPAFHSTVDEHSYRQASNSDDMVVSEDDDNHL